MYILNTSQNLYNWQNPRRTAEFTGATTITATPTLVVRKIYGSATVSGATNITADGRGIQASASVFRGKTTITARGRTRLALSVPPPILNEIAENAFAKQYFTARLLDNLGNEIRIVSASIEAPRGAIGERVSINVARKDLSLITPAKTYTFQIGRRNTPTGAITWKTIVQNGALNSRQFGLAQNGAQPADTLTFGTLEPLLDRLNRYPRGNYILYNSRRTSVELGPQDTIRDTTGAAVANNVQAVNYLSLNDVLQFLRKNTGYEQIVHNLPNFEITRADFTVTSSWMQTIAQSTGIFEPIFFTVGETLYILDKTAAIPDEFTPRALANAELSNWSITVPEQEEIDGYQVSYTGEDSQANFYTDRLVQTVQKNGDPGDDDYSRVETEIRYREWRSTNAPDEILRTEMVSLKRETYVDFLTLGSRRTENYTFDSQGRRTGSQIKSEARVPDLAAAGAPSLQTVREENQSVFYTTDPRNPRRSYQSKTITKIRGIISVDEEKPYFDPETGELGPARQDFMEAHKALNLEAGMTTEYGPIKTIIEDSIDLGGGQYQTSVSTIDHLRKTETWAFSEPKTGDASLPSSFGKQSQIVVLKSGLTLENRPGNKIEPISIGELALFFGIPLIQRKLANREARKQSGTATVIGWDESLDRGTFFRLFTRAGAAVGKFITLGWRVDITQMGDGCQILTSIDADEI